MGIKSTEEKIYDIISIWYKGIEKDVEKWYNTPHALIGVNHKDFSSKTPKERIEAGQAKQVLEYLERIVR